jgi:hypothetical protein
LRGKRRGHVSFELSLTVHLLIALVCAGVLLWHLDRSMAAGLVWLGIGPLTTIVLCAWLTQCFRRTP